MRFLKRILTLGKDEFYEDAMQFYNNCMYVEAIEKFKVILKNKPHSTGLHKTLSKFYCGQAHRNLGEVFFATGNFLKASQEFEEVLQFNPDSREIYQYLGICFDNLGDSKRAHDAFTKTFEKDPIRLSPRSRLGIIFHNLGIWDKALSTYQEILEKHPDYADIHFHLGLAHLGKGMAHEAASDFQHALKINPRYIRSKAKLGITCAYLGNLDEAFANLLAVIEEYPSFADIHFFLGIVHTGLNETEKAIECFNRAIEINPSYKAARVKLGILWCQMERIDEGITELEKAYRLDPDDKALKTVLNTLEKISQSSEPDSRNLYEFLSWFTPKNEATCNAGGGFVEYLLISPNFSDMLSILKTFPQEDSTVYEKLISVFEETISLQPEYSDLHNTLGVFYLKVGKFEKAISSFKEARRINPNYIKARLNLFNTLKKQGNLEEALNEGQMLLDKKLSYPDFLCAVGEVYMLTGMLDEAILVVEKVSEINPTFAPSHFLLAQIYLKQGKKDKVTEELRKCLDSDPAEIEHADIKAMFDRINTLDGFE